MPTPGRLISGLSCLVFLFVLSVTIRADKVTDGSTPLGLQPGAPAGSYPLSDFDNINYFNGGLNVRFPLLNLSGRGNAGFTSIASFEPQKWTVDHWYDQNTNTHYYWPDPNWWGGFQPGFGPGVLQGRQSGEGSYTCYLYPEMQFYFHTITRLTFTMPDGTEYELRDQLTFGKPHNANSAYYCTLQSFNRGRVFVTADGTAATFTSDADIMDAATIVGEGLIYPSGILALRDGTKYRIDNGLVSWVRDRNGNKLTFTYGTSFPAYNAIISAKDARNRTVSFEYSVTDPQYGTGTRITYKGFGGAGRTIFISQAPLASALRSGTTQTYQQLFPQLNSAGSSTHNPTVAESLWLPNRKRYRFKYNSYGELARIELPTGGAIEYDYAGGLTNGPASGAIVVGYGDLGQQNWQVYRRVVQRRIYKEAADSVPQSTMTVSRPESYNANQNAVLTQGYVEVDQKVGDANGALINRARHHFYGSAGQSLLPRPGGYPSWEEGREHKTESYDSNGSTLLRRVTQQWAQRAPVTWWSWWLTQYGAIGNEPPNDTRLTESVTTLVDTNQVAKQTFSYDSYNNPTNRKEYDFGVGAPGGLVRETRTTYVTSSSYTGADVHLRSLPLQVSIHDGAGIERARTVNEYDNYTTNANHGALINRLSISGFDGSFGTSYLTRGNVTAVTHYLLVNGSVTGSISGFSQYDIAGNIVKSIDGRGFVTTLEYDDCFGSPDGNARLNSQPLELSSVGQVSFAFATKVTNHLGHLTWGQFDYYLGSAVDGEDPNGVVTSSDYNDPLDRPKQIRRAAGVVQSENQTTFNYDDVTRVITTTSDLNANNDNALVSKTFYDGLGRATETRQYEGGTNYIVTQTQYDALGRVFKTSNPFRPWQGENPVWTTTAFDALGRVLTVTTPDNSVVTSSYGGNTVTVTDQIGKKRKSVTDALGRLKEVFEDPLGLNYQTSYGHDVVDNLTTVTQGTQTRTFVYDSLKRLTSATNSESGTISYQYDNNGNLTQKTDARSIVTTYAYDALNRNTTVDYSDTASINPDITRVYDTATNGKGRLRESYANGTETAGATVEHTKIMSYDALGRPLDQRQRFKSNSVWSSEYRVQSLYNLAGGVTTQTYPSGRTVTYNYDPAGRLGDKDAQNLAFTGNLGDGVTRNYSTEIIYSPFGGIAKEKFGTDTPLYNKTFYNSRGQMSEIRVGTTYTDPTDGGWQRGAIINHYSGQCWGACNGTDNNGNLKQQDHWIPDSNGGVQRLFVQSFTYDNLNRLLRANEGSNWQQEYVYDRWGNRTIHQTNTWGTGINKKDFTVNTANNRLGVPGGQSGTMTYDNAGNLTNDTYTGAGSRVYDAENRMTKAWGGNNQWQEYSYNADGQRTRRKVDGVETWQIYGMDGELLAEYAANGAVTSPQKEYGYRNGQLLITAEARTNFALAANGGVASASSTTPDTEIPGMEFQPSSVTDGNRTGSTFPHNAFWRDGTNSAWPDWLQVDFNGSKTIDEIDVFTVQDTIDTTGPVEPTETLTFSLHGITGFEVQYWNGSSWVTVPNGSVTGNNKVWRKFTFTAITTSKMRVTVNAALNGRSRFVELEAWGPLVPRTNVALGANGGVASASSTTPDTEIPGMEFQPSSVTDGNRSGSNYPHNAFWRDGTNNTWPDWLQVDFNGSKTIDEIDVITVQDTIDTSGPVEPTETMTFSLHGITAFDVQYWNGSAWVTVPGGSVTGNNKVWRKFTFTPVMTSKVRVTVNAALNSRSRIVELEAWTAASGSSGASINWLVADHLGTPRIILDKSGSLAITKRHDYLPFGEELFAGVGGRSIALGYTGGDGVRQRFTSKERDNETGLDYFGTRYYSSTQGRFTSPDEPLIGQDEPDPQTWNLYSYTSNNPLIRVDEDGQRWFYRKVKDGWEVQWVNPNEDGCYTAPQGEGWKEHVPSRENGFNLIFYSADGNHAYYFGVNKDGSPKAFWLHTGRTESRPDHILAAAFSIQSILNIARASFTAWQATRMAATEEIRTVATQAGATTIQQQVVKATAGKITGFTKHGINQAISRDGVGVATRAIADAVQNPIKVVAGKASTKYIGQDATVVLNKAGKVVTTWARNSAGHRIRGK